MSRNPPFCVVGHQAPDEAGQLSRYGGYRHISLLLSMGKTTIFAAKPFVRLVGTGPKSAGLNIAESRLYPASAAGESFLVSFILLLFTQRVKSNMTDRCPEDKSSGGVWGEAPGPCLRFGHRL